MWKVSKYSKVGERNRESGLLCQDYIHYRAKDSVQAITFADGTGENDFARMGAEHSCKILTKLLVEHFEELYAMEKSLVQFHVITNVQTELYRLCNQYRTDLKNFHSTLLGIVIDDSRELFMAVHLGDGSIKNIDKFILVSDGWNEKIIGKRRFIQEKLSGSADESTYIDDVSFIALTRKQ